MAGDAGLSHSQQPTLSYVNPVVGALTSEQPPVYL
ncbi:cytochrome P450 [Aspergillus luchuensis]|uniref:Cytochrome P450 n=1 Tax=Aspergillus kawachii TaxID=1069201 RepID=A0A146FE35_ASPKA|nr:cytochrome P450 [Aspergillus luchuensis]